MANTKTTKTSKPAATDSLDFNEIEGSELLIPISKVKGSAQARLLSRVQLLGLDNADGEDGIADLDLDLIADLVDYVSERFAVDSAAFDEFTSGPGGMSRAINLAVAFAAELGKGEN